MEIWTEYQRKSPKEIKEAIYQESSNHAVVMKQLAKDLARAHLHTTTEKMIEFEDLRDDILDEAAELQERIS